MEQFHSQGRTDQRLFGQGCKMNTTDAGRSNCTTCIEQSPFPTSEQLSRAGYRHSAPSFIPLPAWLGNPQPRARVTHTTMRGHTHHLEGSHTPP